MVAVNAKDLPINQPTEVTAFIIIKDKDYLGFDSNDKVVEGGVRHPIKDVAIWFHGNEIPQFLRKAANTGKPITLHGFFK